MNVYAILKYSALIVSFFNSDLQIWMYTISKLLSEHFFNKKCANKNLLYVENFDLRNARGSFTKQFTCLMTFIGVINK